MHQYRTHWKVGMNKKATSTERWIALVLALAVFSAGLVVSFVVFNARAGAHRQAVADNFEDTAKQYAFLIQRHLDAYAATNRSLAAYVSASTDIDALGLQAFIRTAGYFERMQGLSSLGYAPRVTRREAAAFERKARTEFPGYRIRDPRPGADFLYPQLYGVDAVNSTYMDAARGCDLSSVADRLPAIQAAEATGMPAATRVHASIHHKQAHVVLTFTPVATLPGAAGRGQGSGVVYTAMNVDKLFTGTDNGRIDSEFDLEVYQVEDGRRSVVYDADGIPHVGASDLLRQLAYSSELRYADKTWVLYFFAKPAYLAAHEDRHSWMVFAIGALLSMMAAYLTFRAARFYVIRQRGAELAGRFAAFFEAHPFATYVLDRERRMVSANQRMAKELGVAAERLIGAPVDQFIVAENREFAAEHFRNALAGHAVAYNNTIRSADGTTSELAIVLIPMLAAGEVTRVLGFAENITERKRIERELYESRQKLRLILDTIPQRVFWKDVNSVYLGANRRLLEEAGLERVEQIVGLSDDDMPWREFTERYRDEDRQVIQTGEPLLNVQQSVEHADGTVSWFESSKVPLRDGEGAVVGLLGVARDITDSKRMEAELVRRANYDNLTGLPNRAYFYSELQQAIKRAQRRSGELALMYFDIDRFKHINDTFGHDVGDVVIRTFAERVRSVLRQSDFVARLGGDEFVLIVEELGSRAEATGVAEKLVAAMAPPFDLGGCTHPVSTSIGIAILEPGMGGDQLLKAADDAMYQAKRAGRNCFRGDLNPTPH
jgi:diguanylate cyclase (GGDEF)-like protein/PAS domain S-box-containing protein